MIPSLQVIANILKLNTSLLNNALINVDDNIARLRPNNRTNNIAFIVCHILDARYFMAKLIGEPAKCPFQEIFDQAANVDEFKKYPKVNALIVDGKKISNHLMDVFTAIDESVLKKDASFKFPSDDNTILGALTFLVEHESYHIGQIGFLRKYFGLEAMKYNG